MPATRKLLCLSMKRSAREEITIHYSTKTPAGDGSYNLVYTPETLLAGVVDLSEDQINRLQSGGITINDGIMVTIPKELPKIPDYISQGTGSTTAYYKIEKDVIAENVTIMTCSRQPYGFALPEVGA